MVTSTVQYPQIFRVRKIVVVFLRVAALLYKLSLFVWIPRWILFFTERMYATVKVNPRQV